MSTLRTWDAHVYGNVFDLPAGPVQLAAGVQFMTDSLSYSPDRNTATGGWLQATPTEAFDASRSNEGYYAEVRVPVFSGPQRATGLVCPRAVGCGA